MNQERVIAASQPDAQSGAENAANSVSSTTAQAQLAGARPGTVRLTPPQSASSEGEISAATLGADNTMLIGMPGASASAADAITGEHGDDGHLLFLEDGAGRRFVLRPGVNTVGRDHTDIQIADRSISRYHGMIVYDEERDLCSVEDSGSLNGSRVNGERLLSHRPRAIHPGDQVTFGDIILRFVDAAGGAIAKPAEPAIASPEVLAEVAHEIEAAPTPLLEDFIWLKLLRGDAPQEILVGQGVTTIGRLPDNIVCLNEDRYVSGHHAKIEARGEVFLLLDVGSTNGTYLNGLRLTTNTAVAMSDNDEVLLGGLLFQVCKPSLDAFAGNDAFANFEAPHAASADESE